MFRMDSPNNTEGDTEYRTTSRPPKIRRDQSPTTPSEETGWTPIQPGQTHTIAHPGCAFSIEFRVGGRKVVCSQDCESLVRGVTLVKEGDEYKCLLQTARKRPESSKQGKPAKLVITSKPPQPARRRTDYTGARA